MFNIRRLAILCFTLLLSFGSYGVYAMWRYAEGPVESVSKDIGVGMWDPDYPALKNAQMKFLDILNNTTDYETLCGIFKENLGSWTSDASYTGSVAGAGTKQSAAVKELFDGELSMEIYGEVINVTVLLKRQNLDNNENTGVHFLYKEGFLWNPDEYWSGAEMVMYYTADPLTTAGKTDTKVFASVFSVRANSNSETPATGDTWQLLATYEGMATTTNWSGSTNGTGSFNTTTWHSLSTSSYTRYDNQTNNPINGAQTLEYLVQNEQEAQTVLKKLLNQ